MYELGAAFAAGVVGSLLVFAGLARKVYNLQCDLVATQAQLLKEKNSRAALTRYKDKEALEVLREVGAPPVAVNSKNPLSKFGVRG